VRATPHQNADRRSRQGGIKAPRPPHESDQRDGRGDKAADRRLGDGDGIDHKLTTTEVSEGIRVGRIDELGEDVATCHRLSEWIGLQGVRREVRVGPGSRPSCRYRGSTGQPEAGVAVEPNLGFVSERPRLQGP
jgi:hypothetical protein